MPELSQQQTVVVPQTATTTGGKSRRGRHEVKRSKLKTKLCQFILQGAPCPYGERCAFAHGEDELRDEGAPTVSLRDMRFDVTPLASTDPLESDAAATKRLQLADWPPTCQMQHLAAPQQPTYFILFPNQPISGGVPTLQTPTFGNFTFNLLHPISANQGTHGFSIQFC